MAPCVLLCALLLAVVEGFTHEDMKGAMLKQLGLSEVPKIHKRDLENLVVPAHVKTKYLNLLKVHNKRRRRSLPSLAGILRGIPGNAGTARFLLDHQLSERNYAYHAHQLERISTVVKCRCLIRFLYSRYLRRVRLLRHDTAAGGVRDGL